MAKDFRSFLEQARRQQPEDLIEVNRTVDPQNFEVTGILMQLERQRRRPMVLFNRTRDLNGDESPFRMVSNVFASRPRCALALGLDPSRPNKELGLGYASRSAGAIEPVVVGEDEAPVRECVVQGDQADVRKLPMVRHFEMDMGPVFTMAHAMKSAEGFYDLSFAKTFYRRDPRHMVVCIHTPDLSRMVAEHEARNEPAPIVNVLGHHPAFFLGALAPKPWANDDYATIGSFLEEPVRLVPSVTWGEKVMVPADAEMVIEGEIPPGVREICDPFGEVAGLYQAQCLRPAFEVKAITYRKDAIIQDIFSGYADGWINAVTHEGDLLLALQSQFGNVTAVHIPDSGSGLYVAYVSIRKAFEGQAKDVGLSALTQWPTLQTVIVVEDDVDVFDEREVLWAVQTFANPLRDIEVLRNMRTTILTTAWQGTKVVIDATRPATAAFPARARVPKDVLERIKLEDWLD